MSTVIEPPATQTTETLEGVVRGRIIELNAAPKFEDGQRVAVELRKLPDPVFASEFSSDVLRFAKQQQVELFLPRVVELTRHTFPSARQIAVVLEEDPEIAHDRHIVIEVDATGLNVDCALEARRRWCREIFQCCPSTSVCVFRLALELSK